MQEDKLMAAHDDTKKDLATNYGLYNLSLDLIQNSGYSGDLDPDKWNNSLAHVEDATNIILDYLHGEAPKRIPRFVQTTPRHAVLLAGGNCGMHLTCANETCWCCACLSWSALT